MMPPESPLYRSLKRILIACRLLACPDNVLTETGEKLALLGVAEQQQQCPTATGITIGHFKALHSRQRLHLFRVLRQPQEKTRLGLPSHDPEVVVASPGIDTPGIDPAGRK